MKKIIAALLVFAMVGASFSPVAHAEGETFRKGEGRGGVMGFIAGCCFGIRAGADYNEGKEIVWREWVRLIPYVGLVFAIWDGVDGANGISRADYAEKFGSTYF